MTFDYGVAKVQLAKPVPFIEAVEGREADGDQPEINARPAVEARPAIETVLFDRGYGQYNVMTVKFE